MLHTLPRWAVVAFAARCARRVEPLFRRCWPDAPRDLLSHVAQAVAYAERCAAKAESEPELAKVFALWADEASERAAFGPKAVAESGAYSAAHAAANAVGSVAYPEEAAVGAYYAAVDATGALRAVLGEGDDAIRADLESLERAAREGGWTDETPVPPAFFSPLPQPPVEALPEDEAARLEAYHAWERAGRPSLSRDEQDRMYFEALNRVRKMRGS
ncbi:MAG: hypothetical protein AB1486_03880 [Planctomycetota bacterium]